VDGREYILTPRERQVFQLLAAGLTGPEIAESLSVSMRTVRSHVQNGIDRLGAETRVHAVALAITRGEISV
jgi:DNA-binding NarL/FixJ family response regulator